MFDYLKNLTKSNEEKRQEAAAAYLDNSLSPKDKAAFENQLKLDERLNEELNRQKWVKEQLQSLPAIKAPRNFILDPTKFRAPASQLSYRIYPALRTATVVAAVLFVFLFGLDQFTDFDQEQGRVGQVDITSFTSAENISEEPVLPAVVVAETGDGDDIPVEEAPAAGEQELSAALSQQAEIVAEESAVAEAEVEMEEEVAPAELSEGALFEAVPVDDASLERLPGESTEGIVEGESSAGSVPAEDGVVAPLSPSDQVDELTEPTPFPDASSVPAATLTDNLLATVQVEKPSIDQSSPETIPETISEAVEEELTLAPTTEAPASEPILADSADTEEVPAEEIQPDATSEPQIELSSVDIVQIALGIGLLALLAVTVLLRLKLR